MYVEGARTTFRTRKGIVVLIFLLLALRSKFEVHVFLPMVPEATILLRVRARVCFFFWDASPTESVSFRRDHLFFFLTDDALSSFWTTFLKEDERNKEKMHHALQDWIGFEFGT